MVIFILLRVDALLRYLGGFDEGGDGTGGT